MKSLLQSVAAIGLMAAGFILYLFPSIPIAAATTTTIIGWNVPNATTFGHGLIELILPLAGMGLFASFPLMVEQKGSMVVTMSLIGLLAGNLLGMMSLSATDPTDISFAFPIVAGMFLVLWLWKGN